MSLSFGTDGIRGLANTELTPELALAVGRAVARVLRPTALFVGRDTRVSGPMLEAAFAAGVASEDVPVLRLGIVPTPAVAFASAADPSYAGAAISASHNPWQDNGIKVFCGGNKLTDAQEEAIESELHIDRTRGAVATVSDTPQIVDRWLASIIDSIGGRRFDGVRVVLDCANGAAAVVGPELFRALGAEVQTIATSTEGVDINRECGATHPEVLRVAVVDAGADFGIALDGDADRCIAVDAAGEIVDGDQILAILALDRRKRGALPYDTVVVTVMTNLGFRQAMADHGIAVVDTAVGDRYVLEAMESGGFALGGEQSGHIIQRDLATTGDGLLTAVQLSDVVVRSGERLTDLAAVMTRLPQVLRNVRLASRPDDLLDRVASDVAAAEAELGDAGRVLLRASGTEPVVRVMVEAATEAHADEVAARLVGAVEAAAG